MRKEYKIAVAGMGYVGLSLAVLLAQRNRVFAVDVIPEKITKINARISPIQDREIEEYLRSRKLNLTATMSEELAYSEADFVIIAVPTNYDSDENYFDTSLVEDVISAVLRVNSNAVIIIKSTIPVGYTKRLREEFSHNRILFSPEFLRESRALYDNLYPSRIVIGVDEKSGPSRDSAELFADLMKENSVKESRGQPKMGALH